MPCRAALVLSVSVSVLLTGCAQWPGPDHRAVTLDGIRALLAEQPQVAPEPATVIQSPQPSCVDLSGVEQQLEGQRVQISRLNKQLQALTAASPAFANSVCPPAAPASYYDDKVVVGSTEWIYLTPPGHHYQARIDSGATTSSLSAQDITRFERNGKRWVRFKLQHDDEAEPIEIEAPLVRNVRIRQASAENPERRPVVSLTVNLGTQLQQDAEFTLTDRSQMTYPILLGREFLRDITLIDVGRTNIQPKFQPDNGQLPVSPAVTQHDKNGREPVVPETSQAETVPDAAPSESIRE